MWVCVWCVWCDAGMYENDEVVMAHSVSGVWVIVVAAGVGVRFGGPKQFQPLHGQRVIDWVVQEAARQAQGVVVVVSADRVAEMTADAQSGQLAGTLTSAGLSTEVLVTAGGVLRSGSVRRALALIPEEAEVIVVHDGSRPLADAGIYQRVIQAVREGAAAAVPVVDLHDTIRWRAGAVVDRSALVAVQTPQGFRADVLRTAHASGADATDDASLAEAAGAKVEFVEGDTRNFKITDPHDLIIAEALISLRKLPDSASDSGKTLWAGRKTRAAETGQPDSASDSGETL